MGKDVPEKILEDFNDVFADIHNALVFKGRKVLDEKELVPMVTEAFTIRPNGKPRQGNRDIRKADKQHGQYRLICGLENQEGCDNTMPVRVMGYNFAAYEEQIREITEKNRQRKKPAITKRIHDDQRLAPVITTVLYYGNEKWERPLSLYDMLEFPEDLAEEIKPYVADYPINLISLAELTKEERERFQSDFRMVAEYIACGRDMEKFKEIVSENRKSIKHPKELLAVLDEGKTEEEYRSIVETLMEKNEGEEGIKMQGFADYYVNEGIQKGIQRGQERLNKLNLHLISEKRYQDLERAAKDGEYRKELFDAYGI